MLPEIVEKQKAGVTARQLFGTVTERVQSIVAGPTKDPDAKSPDWQIAVDGGLLVGGLFALVTGSDVDVKPKYRYATNGTLHTSHQLYRRGICHACNFLKTHLNSIIQKANAVISDT